MKHYPALEIRASDPDLVYAALDDHAPTAIEEHDGCIRAFFAAHDARDAALAALASRFDASAVDVPDDDWARRSQDNLQPVTVGRITIVPRAGTDDRQSSISIVILPSMGFGTGHHASTRLCLAAMQEIDLAGRTLLDVGTGSGVLAIAGERLGAVGALGIDFDADAIQSARENLALNPRATRVRFEIGDLNTMALPLVDVVTANLTGAQLVRAAGPLLAAARPGGIVILSGILRDERDEVRRAFAGADTVWEQSEDEWVGLAVKKR